MLTAALLLGACSRKSTQSASATAPDPFGRIPQPGDTRVKLETNYGDIVMLLYGDVPKHTRNITALVNEKIFDGMLFHRVIKDFMIQTGDPTSGTAPDGVLLGDAHLGYYVDAELMFPKYFHRRGVVAAAREPDDVNPRRESCSCQFYIVEGRKFTDSELDYQESRVVERDRKAGWMQEGDTFRFPAGIREVYKTEGGTPWLDGAYTVFGHVLEGMDVVDRIQTVATDKNDRPLEPVKIVRATVLK